MYSIFDADFNENHQQLIAIFKTLQQADKNQKDIFAAFSTIIKHYHQHKRRTFAWREHIYPYHVVVSEIMLQQTQTHRVAQKFEAFIAQFPTFESLAQAPFNEVLFFWKGLGYNRRALALQKIANMVITEHQGTLPSIPEILETFPGIGPATARSITTFAFNKPTTFIETNIRTVFIYFFFKNQKNVHDKEIYQLVEQTVDQQNPREWYYALMDYGVMLKKIVGNLSTLSSHYHKQSKFQGSDRQIRGMILQLLLDHQYLAEDELIMQLAKEEQRVINILHDLCKEGFVIKQNQLFSINKNLKNL